jgi:hypothetical protein
MGSTPLTWMEHFLSNGTFYKFHGAYSKNTTLFLKEQTHKMTQQQK